MKPDCIEDSNVRAGIKPRGHRQKISTDPKFKGDGQGMEGG